MKELTWRPTAQRIRLEENKYILYSLLEQGVALEYQCLEGHCGACELVLVEGEVEYDPFYQDGRFDAASRKGRFYPCVCYPAAKRLIAAPVGLS